MRQSSIVFGDRDFSPAAQQPAVALSATKYTWHCIGGPKRATIDALGPVEELWNLFNLLRCPVTIYNEDREAVWWGFVNEVELQTGRYRVGATMDNVANRVAVTYNLQDGSNSTMEKAVSTWHTHSESISIYGVKEAVLSLSNSTDAAAEAFAETSLQLGYKPHPTVQFQEGTRVGAVLHCSGWWDTLDWRYYTQTAGSVTYQGGTPGEISVGNSERAVLAQSFIPSDAQLWMASKLSAKVRKIGNPTAKVRFMVYPNEGGYPGTTAISSGLVDLAQVTSDMGWVSARMSPVTQLLSKNVAYWFVVTYDTSAGTVDNDNYYRVTYDVSASESSLFMASWNGTWSYVAGDMHFRVDGLNDNADQIRAIMSPVGSFFTTVFYDSMTGIASSPSRDGVLSAKKEVEALMEVGTTTAFRLLSRVNSDRSVLIYPEPSSSWHLWLDSAGRVYTYVGHELRKSTCPVGQWARIKNLIPATVSLGSILDPSLVFIEEAEYSPKSGVYVPTARGVPSVWDLTSLTGA